MRDAFFDFEWTVAPRYEWQDWLDPNGRSVVVPKDGLESLQSASAVEFTWNRARERKEQFGPLLCPCDTTASNLRRYHPMHREHAALFREFADLEYDSRDAILAFAHRYGRLGLHEPPYQSAMVKGADGEMYYHHAYGEPHLDWALEICLMREGLHSGGRKQHSKKELHRLKWLFDRKLQHVQGRIGFDKAGEPKLTLEPLSLISAMWLQLALAITGEKRFESCKFCGRTFEISTEQTGFRSHREFCADSCKTMDYRKRKRTAIRLAADGRGLREISDKTNTETKTVRAWLAASRARTRAKSGGA